jgi:hypothetical protein
MAMIFEYFAAADDTLARAVLNRLDGPGETLDGVGIDPIVSLSAMEGLLTGTPFDEIIARPRTGMILNITEDRRMVVTLNAEVQTALITASTDQLRDVAGPWSSTDELTGTDPEILATWLNELADLGRQADAVGDHLYCWISV